MRNKQEVDSFTTYHEHKLHSTPCQRYILSMMLREGIEDLTYNLMHGDKDENSTGGRVEADEALVLSDDILAGRFILLLPATICGYGFRNKKWSEYLPHEFLNNH
jgi:hypothetical protein